MSRHIILAAGLALLIAAVAANCSKSAGSKETPGVSNSGAQERIAVPGAKGGPGAGGPGEGARGTGGDPQVGGGAPAGADDVLKLKPEEGQLSIEVPADAVAGQETTARVVVSPTAKYKINVEFPTKLVLEPPAEVTIAKAELKAGGQSKSSGDAEKFEERQLAFAVKLTPTKSGEHTVKGMFKFAVCDKDACLAKKEAIAFRVAAK